MSLFFPQRHIGQHHLVLIDKESRKSSEEWAGLTDTNKRVVFPKTPIPHFTEGGVPRGVGIGDYVFVRVESASSSTLRAQPVSWCSSPQDIVKFVPPVASRSGVAM